MPCLIKIKFINYLIHLVFFIISSWLIVYHNIASSLYVNIIKICFRYPLEVPCTLTIPGLHLIRVKNFLMSEGYFNVVNFSLRGNQLFQLRNMLHFANDDVFPWCNLNQWLFLTLNWKFVNAFSIYASILWRS